MLESLYCSSGAGRGAFAPRMRIEGAVSTLHCIYQRSQGNAQGLRALSL